MTRHTTAQKRICELAKAYYPTLWDIDRIKTLTVAGKLTTADYKAITGQVYRKENDMQQRFQRHEQRR